MRSPVPDEFPAPSALVEAVAIGIGGALGASARWAAQWLWPWPVAPQNFGMLEPVLVINVLGAFLLGILLARLERSKPHPLLRPFLAVGVLGTFTTWSSLVAEITLLDASGRTDAAVIKLGLSLLSGLIAFVIGQRLASNREASS